MAEQSRVPGLHRAKLRSARRLVWLVGGSLVGCGLSYGLVINGERDLVLLPWLCLALATIGLVNITRLLRQADELSNAYLREFAQAHAQSSVAVAAEPKPSPSAPQPEAPAAAPTPVAEAAPEAEPENLYDWVDFETVLEDLDPAPAFFTTRTEPNHTGVRLVDRYEGIERAFTADEDDELLELYDDGQSLVAIATSMQIDQRQVAIRLIRLLLDPPEAIDDVEAAASNGQRYARGEKAQIVEEFLAGQPIEAIAHAHDRTVLGIGWLLLEHPSRPVDVNPDSKRVI